MPAPARYKTAETVAKPLVQEAMETAASIMRDPQENGFTRLRAASMIVERAEGSVVPGKAPVKENHRFLEDIKDCDIDEMIAYATQDVPDPYQRVADMPVIDAEYEDRPEDDPLLR